VFYCSKSHVNGKIFLLDKLNNIGYRVKSLGQRFSVRGCEKRLKSNGVLSSSSSCAIERVLMRSHTTSEMDPTF
jgi:hypothetical protein